MNTTISTSEWQIMRVIWTLGEATSNQIIRILCAETDWQPSTVKTLITRLIKKGIISHNGAARDRIYTATITEKVAMVDTLSTTLHEMCAMCVGDALVNALADTPLSQTDINHLQALLAKKSKTAPPTIACNCIPKGWEACHDDREKK